MRRVILPFGLAAVFCAALVLPVSGAQQLPLKRELPAATDQLCPAAPPATQEDAVEASQEDLDRAEALAVEGNQAAILGDHVRARAVLREAAFLNPGSPTIAYRLARSLEALGSLPEARLEYCRYIALAPESPDRPEVEERIGAMAAETAGGASPAARRAFQRGLDAFDEGGLEDAVRAFTDAIEESPEWADVHYNRGALRVELGRVELGAGDLERYLELAGAPDDLELVQARLEDMRERIVATRSPSTALATGLLVPGLGHFYTDRTRAGLAVVTLAGASAAAGFLYTEIEVACRTLPQDGRCPPDQVSGTTETRPYLVAGLGGAAAVTFLGAIHAYLGARGAQAGASASTAGPGSQGTRAAVVSVSPLFGPRHASAGLSVTLKF